jgi:mono/diheme cytochrome c family protein
VLVLLPSAIACGDAAVPDRALTASDAPVVAEVVAAAPLSGEALFAHYECAGCHESAAVPGMIVRPLAGLAERYSADTLAAFLAAPPDPMPRLPLSEPERQRLAAYLLDTF